MRQLYTHGGDFAITVDDDFRPTGSRRGEVLGCLGVVVAVGLMLAGGGGLIFRLVN